MLVRVIGEKKETAQQQEGTQDEEAAENQLTKVQQIMYQQDVPDAPPQTNSMTSKKKEANFRGTDMQECAPWTGCRGK